MSQSLTNRQMKIYFAHILLPLLLVTSACSKRLQGPRLEGETPERRMFAVVSDFYCEKKRWPHSLLELTEASKTFKSGVSLDPDTAQYFEGATAAIPRPILYSLEYAPRGVGSTTAPSRRRATFIAPPSCGDEQLSEGAVSIAGGRVTFQLPAGYLPLSLQQIKERWGSGPAPDVAWSDAAGSVTVAVRFGEAQLTVDGMQNFKAGVESAYARSVPGIQWHRREFSPQNEPPLLVHEFSSTSSKGVLRTVALSLSFDSSLLSITATAPEDSAELVSVVSTMVRDSLRLK